MKVINPHSFFTAFYEEHTLPLVIVDFDRRWHYTIQERGCGPLHEEGYHFEICSQYADELQDVQFCLVPENEKDEEILKGVKFQSINKDQTLITFIPHLFFTETKELPKPSLEDDNWKDGFTAGYDTAKRKFNIQ